MKFTCSRENISDAINAVSKAVSPRSVLSVIEGIFIKAEGNTVTLVGNDLELAIECIIPANVKKEGKIVLNAKMMGEIVRRMVHEEIELEVTENNLIILRNGEIKFEIIGINASEFPSLPSFNSEYSVSIKKKQFKDMVKNTIFAVGKSDNKIVLTGCFLEIKGEKVRMVAVDGYRLAMVNSKIESAAQDRSLIIPSKTLNELLKLIKDEDEEILINCTNKHVVFEFDNLKIVSRLIEGEYINYEQIIPKEKLLTVKANVEEIVSTIERAALVITNEINKSPVKMNISDGRIDVSCETSAGKYSDKVLVESEGEALEIGFNHRFLLDALKTCECEEVVMEFNQSTNPCIIKPLEGEDFIYLILPVRLKA